MKKLLLAGVLLFALGGTLSAQTTGRNVAVLAYTADQLAAQFAGSTRKEVVAAINTVPAAEQVYTAQDGREYMLVRYGTIDQIKTSSSIQSISRPVGGDIIITPKNE